MIKTTSFLPSLVAVVVVALAGGVHARGQDLFHADFTMAAVGRLPDGFLVIDGAFSVHEEAGNRFIELPGAPLDTYSLLFGPSIKEDVCVTARIWGSGKGRRYPTFAVGLNGAGGYRLQVSPGKKELELFKADADKASVPWDWPAGQWIWLRLQVARGTGGVWRISGKAWPDGSPEPAGWAIAFDDSEEPRPGRASVVGCPFAGTPIRFDDLKLQRLALP